MKILRLDFFVMWLFEVLVLSRKYMPSEIFLSLHENGKNYKKSIITL